MAASVPGPAEAVRLNHKKARSVLKKERRKRKRQELARQREAEESKEFVRTEDEDEDDLQYEIERQKLHEEWLAREQKAQEQFQLKMEKEEAFRRREEEERKLIEEWRQQEMKAKEEEPEQVKKRTIEEAVQKMLDEAENQVENGGVWHNPEAPERCGTEKDRSNCPFYLKTGACRFGDRCSRKHCYPTSSQTLLVRGMFLTFGMEQCRLETDDSLEYGEDEIYQQFIEFYEDVVPEFKNVGKVIQFKVSCNFEVHLRGNVYVQYQTEEECLQALSQFNGRWYAGRQLQCELSPVTRWKSAICGLFERQKCSRGKYCNFLHVFRNPNNEFWEANRDINVSPDWSNLSERRDRSSRYEDHGVSRKYYSPSPDSRRNGDSSKRKRSHHKRKKKHRLRRSRSRRRSRSKSRKKRRHRSRSRSSSKSRSRRSKSSSRSKSHNRKSRSRSRSRSCGRNRSRSRSRGRNRSRSRSRGRNRSRSRSRGKSRSRSRSRGKSRSRSRSRGKSRSRSRSRGKSRSRSRSRGKSRSRSRSRGKSRSRSREWSP